MYLSNDLDGEDSTPSPKSKLGTCSERIDELSLGILKGLVGCDPVADATEEFRASPVFGLPSPSACAWSITPLAWASIPMARGSLVQCDP